MAQFFSWRFWAAIGALLGLTLVVIVVTNGDSGSDGADPEPGQNRRIDVTGLIWGSQDDDFSMQDGYSQGYLHLNLDAEGVRTITIHPSTPGVARCEQIGEPARCALLVDLLGDAVVWFALVEVSDGARIELPAIAELDEEYAVLTNGWELQYASVLDRRCDVETQSFRDFQERFGTESTSIIDPGENRITAVAC